MSESGLIEAIAETAGDWRDPEFPPRDDAVTETLEAENSFTEEAVAFAVNQQMALLTVEGLRRWIRNRHASDRQTIGVLNAGNIPLVGLQDFLAVILTGHRYRGTISSKSPALLPAFVRDLGRRCSNLAAEFASAKDVFAAADAVIATGSDDTVQWVIAQCGAHDIPPERRLLRGHSFSVAVLDGLESDDDYERLAEDVLLHEGFGCRNIAVIWAPRDLRPDDMLNAFARFRGVFPAHEGTPGRLAMQQAFLEAVDQPHAFGEGLEFLVSRGEPDVQPPGHVRWSEYEDIADVNSWLERHSDRVQYVVARASFDEELLAAASFLPLGEAQRPALDWCPGNIDTVGFLIGLRAA